MKENRELLLKQNFYLPKTLGDTEHIDLVNLVVNSRKKFSRRKDLDLSTLQKVDDYKKLIERNFFSELDSYMLSSRTLIISSERLFSLLTHKHELALLHKILTKYCHSIEIVCYIRPQHEFAKSLYSTLLRNGSYRSNIFPNIDRNSRETRKYDYDQVLRFWQNGFPNAKITVRRFTREHLVEGNVVHDFAQVSGIKLQTLLVPDRKNVSLNRYGQQLLRTYNQHFPEIGHDIKRRMRVRFVTALEKHLSGVGRLCDQSDQQRFYGHFTESNKSLQHKHFPDSEELFDFPFD